MTSSRAGARARILWIPLAVVLVDQATKIWAHAALRGRPPLVVVPDFFQLIYSRNAGGLFGAFSEWGGALRVAVLIVLPVAAVGMILWLLLRGAEEDRRTRAGLALILGGAIGNLIDRVVRGEVVDFLDVYVSADRFPRAAGWLVDTFGMAHWPTFNVADSCIVAGAGLLLLAIVRPGAGTPTAE